MTPLTDAARVKKQAAASHLWITLEATEVIELKRIALDRDSIGALTFFREILAPRVTNAARERGVALELLEEVEKDAHLP